MSDLYLYDFGIFLELAPDDEQKAMLENNIQMSLQQQTIDLEDAIEIREIKNVKLANQLLKIRRKKKMQQDQQAKQQNMQAQAQANAQQQQAAAQAEIQKQQALKGIEIEGLKTREKEKEDRKDERTRIQASQQSELIEQRKGNQPAKKFESAGNDILGGRSAADMSGFTPR